jgi:hypothetical protein
MALMEINLNPNRIPLPELGGSTVARQGSSPAAPDSVSFSPAASLGTSLQDIPLVRPEKVAQAKALGSVTSYPPADLLDRIATLLAVHMKK